jgi:hypothetical protein
MSCVFRNIDPPPHTARPVHPSAFGAGGGHTRWVERGWGVNSSGKTPDTALYSIYVSTLCLATSGDQAQGRTMGNVSHWDSFYSSLYVYDKRNFLNRHPERPERGGPC